MFKLWLVTTHWYNWKFCHSFLGFLLRIFIDIAQDSETTTSLSRRAIATCDERNCGHDPHNNSHFERTSHFQRGSWLKPEASTKRFN
ncbi:Uncharacterized protein APZ42_031225 [Daphnia magna]|uniref:Secreted protein n=1 Tax=Daphnia magna TaxID=35525 RepID=A0A164N1Z2_9CRUS|nr:Uncharacterized protein APZ42_031225 [Daphnia magna]